MLVVMSIVALLLTLALPRYFGSLEKARDSVLQENLQVLRTTIDKFSADTGRYPAQLEELVQHNYLRSIPVDPITETNKTWIVIPSNEPSRQGIVDVKSGAPGKARDGRPYASF